MTNVKSIERFSIRPAEQTDLAAVSGLLEASDLPTVGIAANLTDFLVAQAGRDLIGVVGMEYCCDYGLLRSTAVKPEWRGKGVARQLVEQIIGRAEARGVRALYLLTTTAETYFPSFGFRQTTRAEVPEEIRATDEFRGACPASATVMTLPLPTLPPSGRVGRSTDSLISGKPSARPSPA